MKYLKIVFLISMMTILLSCGKKTNSNDDWIIEPNTGLKFDSLAYDSMRSYFSSDSATTARLTEMIIAGDTNAIKVKKFLATRFSSRHSSGIMDSEIAGMILAFRVTTKVRDRFEDIDRTLQKQISSDSVRDLTENTISKLDSLKKELEQLGKNN
jgi:hypothetical protein